MDEEPDSPVAEDGTQTPASKQRTASSDMPLVGTRTLSGYLDKRGQRYRAWRERWFVVQGSSLYYFKTPQDSSSLGSIDLRGAIVRETPKVRATPRDGVAALSRCAHPAVCAQSVRRRLINAQPDPRFDSLTARARPSEKRKRLAVAANVKHSISEVEEEDAGMHAPAQVACRGGG